MTLIASEVGEAVNECRGEESTEKLPEECADIILMTLDLMVSKGIIGTLLMEFNPFVWADIDRSAFMLFFGIFMIAYVIYGSI